ncbi:phosphatidate cytidylyltransferase [Opitutaceae bacterium TAV4]|nr:phosphatidate cytidylyltransferase [Opitutaceae bacterium TAV4]RRK01546.1 phosphatidate cytidylyltransferase [Opitutaceae bacterium TAV3]
MLKRTLSTLSLWAIVIGVPALLGIYGAVALAVIVAFFTQLELYQMIRRMGHKPFVGLGLFFGVLVMLSPALGSVGFWKAATEFVASLDLGVVASCIFLLLIKLRFLCSPASLLILATIFTCIGLLGRRTPENRVETLGWTLFGILYVPFLLQYLTNILLIGSGFYNTYLGSSAALFRAAPYTGLFLAVWVIATSKFCDVGALLTGLACGKHKMAPVISPKKTWEGAVGGVITSALVGAAIAYFCARWLPTTFTPLLAAALAVPIAILGIVSDLVESIIKRRADTKDSGATIPGIGGMFDLSDSLLLTSPAAFILFSLFL